MESLWIIDWIHHPGMSFDSIAKLMHLTQLILGDYMLLDDHSGDESDWGPTCKKRKQGSGKNWDVDDMLEEVFEDFVEGNTGDNCRSASLI